MTERLEDLKARSKEVLIKVKPEVREKLIRFARTSRDPKAENPSPTKAEKRALQSTRDADKALACWQITAILRDFGEEEFEKHVSDICQKSHQETVSQAEQKLKPEGKMTEEKVRIPLFEGKGSVEFDYQSAFWLCSKLLKGITESDAADAARNLRLHSAGGLQRDFLIESMIELLKKFGIDVKICLNCLAFDELGGNPICGNRKAVEKEAKRRKQSGILVEVNGGVMTTSPMFSCDYWVGSEKVKFSDRLCPNCYDPDCFLVEISPGQYRCPCCKATYSNKEEETRYCCINYGNGCGGPELKKIGDKHYKCPVCNEEYRLNEEGKLLD